MSFNDSQSAINLNYENSNLLEELDANINANDPSVPQWALVLMNCSKVTLNEIKCLKDIALRINQLEDFNRVCENTTSRLQAENNKLNKELQVLRVQVDNHEQRSRNECLLIHGIEENDGENTDDIVLDVINNKLGLANITLDDVQRSHRIGSLQNNQRITRSTPSRPRPIILRFLNYRHRQEVFKKKKLLKHQNVSISENLTQSRYRLYKECLVKLGKGKVWTIDGRITTKINNRYVTINNVDILESLEI